MKLLQVPPINPYKLLMALMAAFILLCMCSCHSMKKLTKNVKSEVVKSEQSNKTETKDSTTKTITKVIDSSAFNNY